MLPKPSSPSFTTPAFAPGNFSVKNLYCSNLSLSISAIVFDLSVLSFFSVYFFFWTNGADFFAVLIVSLIKLQ